MTEEIVFVELGEEAATDAPHCGGCGPVAEAEVVDAPHCGGCN